MYSQPTGNDRKAGDRFPFALLQRVFVPRIDLRPQRWNWSALTAPLDRSIQKDSGTALESHAVTGLRYFWLDGTFSSFSENLAAGFIAIFALAYGATNTQIGVLTALTNLAGALALFPGAAYSERVGRRKPVIVATGGWSARIIFLLLCIVPLFVLPGTVAIWLIIILSAARSFMGSFANPPWTSMAADLVPPDMRGKYFSGRAQAMGVAALIAAPFGGWLIKELNGSHPFPLAGYQVTFLIAFAIGTAATVCFSRIPEVRGDGVHRPKHKRGDLRKALRQSPDFMAFLVGAFIFNFSIQIAGPFFNIYLIKDLHASVDIVGYSAGATSVATLFGQWLFGKYLDTKGSFWVQKITGILIPLLPIMWIVMWEPAQVYIISLASGFLWGGYNLSNFNLLLEYAPDEQRQRAVALYQVVVLTSAIVGPLIGGAIIEAVSYKFGFLVSAVGRLVGVVAFLSMYAAMIRRPDRPGLDRRGR